MKINAYVYKKLQDTYICAYNFFIPQMFSLAFCLRFSSLSSDRYIWLVLELY